MIPPVPGLAVLVFYAFALSLGALLLFLDPSFPHGVARATAITMLAWLLVNRRRLAGD
jgi:hypothetical protein